MWHNSRPSRDATGRTASSASSLATRTHIVDSRGSSRLRYFGSPSMRSSHTTTSHPRGNGRTKSSPPAACLPLGVGLLIGAVVNLVHLGDAAGATTGTVMGILFLLAARYAWSLRRRPTIELNEEGLVFHADVDPVMRLLTGSRTVTFRWVDIEAVEARRTRRGMSIFVDLDEGPEQGRRLIAIAFSPIGVSQLMDQMRSLADGKRQGKPTRWSATDALTMP